MYQYQFAGETRLRFVNASEAEGVSRLLVVAQDIELGFSPKRLLDPGCLREIEHN